MRTISQRELRNDNAEIMRGVESGESYVVTRRGVPIALLAPVTRESDLRCDRPAKERPQYSSRPRIEATTPTADLVADLRGER